MVTLVANVYLLKCEGCEEEVLIVVPTDGFLPVEQFAKAVKEIRWQASLTEQIPVLCPEHPKKE